MESAPSMLPTPDTSHVSYARVYEPAEDSFLLLDTLSSASEKSFLRSRFSRFSRPAPPPLVVEIGSGSGVVIGFINAHAQTLFGTRAVLTAGVDINPFACRATAATARRAAAENAGSHGSFLAAVTGDLVAPWREGEVDVLVFNPPYVPTEELPAQDDARLATSSSSSEVGAGAAALFERDSYLLSLSYAGGRDGMETTDRLIESLPRVLSPRGCAYILLCAQNKPDEVKERIRGFGARWKAETVGESGKHAGWEKLQIVRIWRDDDRTGT